MLVFAELYSLLDQTTKTNEKVAALVDYFSRANAADAIWVLALLSERKIKSIAKTSDLKLWAAELAQIPTWLFDECYQTVGDLAETISHVLPKSSQRLDKPLHEWIGDLLALTNKSVEERKAFITYAWQHLDVQERFVFNKLCTGGFRIGVSQKLIVKAIAKVYGMDESILAHRLMGNWEAQNTDFNTLVLEEGNDDAKPYPFYLAYGLDMPVANLGATTEWQAEYKWDGIRAQLICRNGEMYIWSRGEELVTDKFPELRSLLAVLPNGTVLDGEILAYKDGAILPFQQLQKRITRKKVAKKHVEETPIVFYAYDVLECNGTDCRTKKLLERHFILADLYKQFANAQWFLSARLVFDNWEELAQLRLNAREVQAEGLMLKRLDSSYEVGRKKGDWYKWKLDPYTVDAVLIYAQKGHGRRANLYTDYTFAIWNDAKELVSFTKAYSGLTDKELVAVDAWIKQNTREKFGPVRSVNAELVFELGFEGINYSPRHKSGIALRFPRILRWRTDKKKEDADKLSDLIKWIDTKKEV